MRDFRRENIISHEEAIFYCKETLKESGFDCIERILLDINKDAFYAQIR